MKEVNKKNEDMKNLNLKIAGSQEKTIKVSLKEVADFFSMNDAGCPDDGFFAEKIEANKEYIEQNVTAVFHSGTSLGFECDLDSCYDVLEA